MIGPALSHHGLPTPESALRECLDAPSDADTYKDMEGKFEKFFSAEPGEGD